MCALTRCCFIWPWRLGKINTDSQRQPTWNEACEVLLVSYFSKETGQQTPPGQEEKTQTARKKTASSQEYAPGLHKPELSILTCYWIGLNNFLLSNCDICLYSPSPYLLCSLSNRKWLEQLLPLGVCNCQTGWHWFYPVPNKAQNQHYITQN